MPEWAKPVLMLAVLLPLAAASQSLPTLKLESALYKLDHGVLEFSFIFVNSTDSVLYLDCQVPPKFALEGRNLDVILDRAQVGDSVGSLEAYSPQRIAAHQTFHGQRRFDHILGQADARPDFSTLRLVAAYYPERGAGEGEPFAKDLGAQLAANPIPVQHKGKPPSPPKKIRIAHPVDP